MNKNLNRLSIIPLYGTCILLIHLYIRCLKNEISQKKFVKFFVICGIVSAVCWVMVGLILSLVNETLSIPFIRDYGVIIMVIIAGYMMNAFTFTFINKKWDVLFN